MIGLVLWAVTWVLKVVVDTVVSIYMFVVGIFISIYVFVVDFAAFLYAIVGTAADALYTSAVPGAVSLYMWVDNPVIFWTPVAGVAGAVFLLLRKFDYMDVLSLLWRIQLACGFALILYSGFHFTFPNLAEGAMFLFDGF